MLTNANDAVNKPTVNMVYFQVVTGTENPWRKKKPCREDGENE